MAKLAHCISFSLFYINFLLANGLQDTCKHCTRIEECPWFAGLNIHEQQIWKEQAPCEQQVNKRTSILGFSTIAKENYVCCIDSYIKTYNNENHNSGSSSSKGYNNLKERKRYNTDESNIQNSEYQGSYRLGYYDNQLRSPNTQYSNQQHYANENIDQVHFSNYQGQMKEYSKNEGVRQNFYVNPEINTRNNNIEQNNVNGQNKYENKENRLGNFYQNNLVIHNIDGNLNRNSLLPKQETGNVRTENTWQNSKAYDNKNKKNVERSNLSGQCETYTSLLPDPSTGCCGLDKSNADRINDLQNLNITSFKHHAGLSEKKIDYNERIADTELDQFPWTVLLTLGFDYGNIPTEDVSCGGSLINLLFVLTAGHCVFQKDAKLTKIEIMLSEYDKQTYPVDCIYDAGEMQCINNIRVEAEKVIRYPGYDPESLENDIALIKLEKPAPYTRFIRPICIPPLDINNDLLSFLPLAVAGWGSDGKFVSDMKHSSIVHLVPQEQCKKWYPDLKQTKICAVGLTGADSCHGDSGGPLMMMFMGNYYVIGIVSGKKNEFSCGDAVPVIYTNVFQYVKWIRDSIDNDIKGIRHVNTNI